MVARSTDALPAERFRRMPEPPTSQAQAFEASVPQGEPWRKQDGWESKPVSSSAVHEGRLLVHRRAPLAIGALLSLSFFGGLQTLLVLARNTVTFVPVSAPAEIVRPDLTSPPIKTVPAVPTVPAEGPSEPEQVSVVSGAGGAGLVVPVPDPAPAPAPGGTTDPVGVTPKPAPVGPPPVETAPVQPAPPIGVVPEAPVTAPVPIPVPAPPVAVPPVSGGASVKPPQTSIPLSSSSPPSSKPVPPTSAATTPASSIPLEVV
jgi:hypothetical protein